MRVVLIWIELFWPWWHDSHVYNVPMKKNVSRLTLLLSVSSVLEHGKKTKKQKFEANFEKADTVNTRI